MSETQIKKESRRPNPYQVIQFSDGQTALGLSIPGQRTLWPVHKYTRFLGEPGFNQRAMVTLANGERFGIGDGMIVSLPDYDGESGKFLGDSALSTRRLSSDFPDLEIGSSWEIAERESPVKLLIVRGPVFEPGVKDSHLVVANPFPDMDRLIVRAADTLSRQAPAVGARAVSGFRAPTQ